MLNLTFVKSFVTLADTGSFQKAAERLNLAQPTLSQHINKLEESLGVRLIERKRLGSRPTPQGKSALAVARTLLNTADQMQHVVMHETLVIGASRNICDYYLATELSRLDSRPEFKFKWQLKQADNPTLVNWLVQGGIDVAITEWRPEVENVSTHYWQSDSMVVILPPDHAFADRGEIGLPDLAGLPLLGGGHATGTGTMLREVLGKDAAHLKTAVSMGSTQAVKSAVMSGMGCSIVLRASVEMELKSGHLVAVPLKGFDLRKSFYISLLQERNSIPQLRDFLDNLVSA